MTEARRSQAPPKNGHSAWISGRKVSSTSSVRRARCPKSPTRSAHGSPTRLRAAKRWRHDSPSWSSSRSRESTNAAGAIELLWRAFLDNPTIPSLQPLIDEAATQPSLRQLRPWTSLDRLCFSRWVGWPFSSDLPYAAPRDGRFRVFRANDDGYLSEKEEFVLGEGDAARAVELLVAGLPDPLEVVYRRPSDA